MMTRGPAGMQWLEESKCTASWNIQQSTQNSAALILRRGLRTNNAQIMIRIQWEIHFLSYNWYWTDRYEMLRMFSWHVQNYTAISLSRVTVNKICHRIWIKMENYIVQRFPCAHNIRVWLNKSAWWHLSSGQNGRLLCTIILVHFLEWKCFEVLVSTIPSVRLWTESFPLCIFHNTYRIDFVFTHHINQPQKACGVLIFLIPKFAFCRVFFMKISNRCVSGIDRSD